MPLSILTIVGARPQFIKAAALSAAFAKSDISTELLLHTGQHYDYAMSEVFFAELGIEPPKWNLDLGGGSHGAMTGKMLEGIEKILLKNKPDLVVVFGDTNSTLAGALAAVKLQTPVAHIEAGLRSNNFYQPEEINRVTTDRISKLLYCPSQEAATNLQNENVPGDVQVVGDIMYDSILLARKLGLERGNTIAKRINIKAGEYHLMTLHRQENVDHPKRLQKIIDYVSDHANGKPIVFPAHPRTLQRLKQFKITLPGIIQIEPVGYLDMVALIEDANLLFTDSGGLQKEAYFCGTQCVTLRDETEWLETISAGWNRLWTEENFLPQKDTRLYGDGDSATKIVASIESHLQ